MLHNVIKRNSTKEVLSYDKIMNRIQTIGEKHYLNIQYSGLVVKIIDQLYDEIQTKKIDELMCQQCAMMGTQHYDYSKLAGLLAISNHHKETYKPFFSVKINYIKNKDIYQMNIINCLKNIKMNLKR